MSKVRKSMTARIDERMKRCEQLKAEAVQDLKTLKSEAIQKHDATGKKVQALGQSLQARPGDAQLQKDYAGAVIAKQMFHHAAELNDALLEQENVR